MTQLDANERPPSPREDFVAADKVEAHLLQAVGILAPTFAHGLNNLLAAARGYVDLAQAESSEGTILHRYFGSLEESLTRATGLVEWLQATRIGLATVLQGLDLRNWLDTEQVYLRRMLPTRLDISLRLPPAPVPVRVDALKLRQVLILAAAEARTAGPAAEKLEVELATSSPGPDQEKPMAELTIRVCGTAGRFSPSTLALASRIMVEHGGTATPLDRIDSTLRLDFPLGREIEGGVPLANRIGHVLVVSADRISGSLLVQALREHCRRVNLVAGASENGLDETAWSGFDLVVLDMDDKATRSTFAWVRRRIPNVPLLVLAGSHKIFDKVADEDPLLRIARKPISLPDIVELVTDTLADSDAS